jgi:hypothetical protein
MQHRNREYPGPGITRLPCIEWQPCNFNKLTAYNVLFRHHTGFRLYEGEIHTLLHSTHIQGFKMRCFWLVSIENFCNDPSSVINNDDPFVSYPWAKLLHFDVLQISYLSIIFGL